RRAAHRDLRPCPTRRSSDLLNEAEWQIMRQHPEYARELLSRIEFLRPAIAIPYCHHEKWDGSGYPQGLAGEEIPLAARVFAVAEIGRAHVCTPVTDHSRMPS